MIRHGMKQSRSRKDAKKLNVTKNGMTKNSVTKNSVTKNSVTKNSVVVMDIFTQYCCLQLQEFGVEVVSL